MPTKLNLQDTFDIVDDFEDQSLLDLFIDVGFINVTKRVDY